MNPGGASGEGAAGILKAVGSLLMALSGADQGQVERTLNEMQSPESVPDRGQTSASESEPRRRPAASRGIPGYPQPQGRPPSIPPQAETSQAETARESGRSQRNQPGELLDEVEFVLADARERAQRIIDESMDHARELIQQERAAAVPATGIDPRAFDDLRRGLRGLVTEVRDIQQRLARIEQLLRDQNERAPSPSAIDPASSAATPVPMRSEHEYGEPPRAYTDVPIEEPAPAWRAPEPPTAEEPPLEDAPWAEEPEPNISEFEAASDPSRFNAPRYTPPSNLSPGREIEGEQEDRQVTASGNPAPAPPRSAFSVVPPQRREWAREAEPGEADEPGKRDEAYGAEEPPFQPAASPEAPGAAVEEPEPRTTSGSPLATFLPSDGAITLRITPVAGFQGLMRVQDALTRLTAVRHASVEAYSQGEARLRLELADSADSDELAEGLSRALNGSAYVEDASEVDRELLITLR